MKVHGRLKKWMVDNKLDKEGDPQPVLTMSFEVPFKPHQATSLGKLTNGDAIEIEILKSQLELDV